MKVDSCCVRDEGRLLVMVVQTMVTNRLKLLPSRAVVVALRMS